MTEYRTDKMVELLGEAQPESMPPKKENHYSVIGNHGRNE